MVTSSLMKVSKPWSIKLLFKAVIAITLYVASDVCCAAINELIAKYDRSGRKLEHATKSHKVNSHLHHNHFFAPAF
jgi:hypothetical protein